MNTSCARLATLLQTNDTQGILELFKDPSTSPALLTEMRTLGLHRRLRLLPKHELLLSVIVPVYNTAPYLRQCLESLAGQTLVPQCWEVILVDDKSDDESLEICQEYARRFPNFHVLALPEHTPGGCGIPANSAMKVARGVYTGFADSDDYLLPDAFEELLINAFLHDADVSFCGQHRHHLGLNKIVPSPDQVYCSKLSDPAFILFSETEKRKLYLNTDTPPWLKIYRTQFLQEQELCFPEGEAFFEDLPFHWMVLLSATRIAVLDSKLIVHRQGRPGQTIAATGKKWFDVIPNLQLLAAFLKKKGHYTQCKYVFLRSLAIRIRMAFPKMTKSEYKDFFHALSPLGNDFSFFEISRYAKDNSTGYITAIRHYILCKKIVFFARILETATSFCKMSMRTIAKRFSNAH